MRISIRVRVYSGIRYIVQSYSGLTCGTPGDRGECLLPIPESVMTKGIHKTLLNSLAAGFRHQATEQSWTVIPGMYGVHCKHSSSIPPLFPITTLSY